MDLGAGHGLKDPLCTAAGVARGVTSAGPAGTLAASPGGEAAETLASWNLPEIALAAALPVGPAGTEREAGPCSLHGHVTKACRLDPAGAAAEAGPCPL